MNEECFLEGEWGKREWGMGGEGRGNGEWGGGGN